MLNAAPGAGARRNSLAQVRLDPAANVPLLAALLDIPLPTMLPLAGEASTAARPNDPIERARP